MAVDFGNTTERISSSTANISSYALTHNNDRSGVILILSHNENASVFTAPTIGGISMQLIASRSETVGSDGRRGYVYYLPSAPVGSNTINVQFGTGQSRQLAAIAMSVSGLDDSFASQYSSGATTSGNPSASLSVADSGIILGVYAGYQGGSPLSGQTVVESASAFLAQCVVSYNEGLSGSVTQAWSGGGVGSEVSLIFELKEEPKIPEVTTDEATNIAGITATLNGEATQLEDGNATERGFYLVAGTSGDPTSGDTVISEAGDFGIGIYSLESTGLTAKTSYRVAAFVTNVSGTAIGNTIGFTTNSIPPTVSTNAASVITEISATLNGQIDTTGGENSTERGFYYKVGLTGDPTAADNIVSESGDFGVGAFDLQTGLLTQNTNYRVAAFAKNPLGISVGPTISFSTLITPSEVTTNAASDITNLSAIFNANITNIGGANVLTRGFYYKVGSTGDPTSADITVSESGDFGAGVFSLASEVLLPDTEYRIASFVDNGGGIVIGATVGILTYDLPSITTDAASGIQATSVVGNANITDTGNINNIERGFYYLKGVVGDPTAGDNIVSESGDFGVGAFSLPITGLDDSSAYRVAAFSTNEFGTTVGATVSVSTSSFKKVIGGGVGEMSAIIDSLDPDTTYYIRAYATNSEGTSYGDEEEFKTIKSFIPLVIIGG